MNADKNKSEELTRRFSDYLARTRRRHTPERFMVLECVESTGGHFTVDDLCTRMAESGHRVSTATVYNTVLLLVDSGIVLRHRFNERECLYELSPAGHHHLICTNCGRIKDIRDTTLDEFLHAKRYTGFTPSRFAVSVYGLCSACRKRKKAEVKKKRNLK